MRIYEYYLSIQEHYRIIHVVVAMTVMHRLKSEAFVYGRERAERIFFYFHLNVSLTEIGFLGNTLLKGI